MQNIGSITSTSGKTFETYQTEMEKNKCYLGNGLAEKLMENSGFVTKDTTMDLIAYRLSELGFTQPVDSTEIKKMAKSLGLKECPEGIIFETVFTLLPKIIEFFPEDDIFICADLGLWGFKEVKGQQKYLSCIYALGEVGFYPSSIFIFGK